MIMQTFYGGNQASGRQANNYLAQRINGATPEELAAMLLEGAQRFLTQAVGAIRKSNLPERARLVNRVSLIMDELVSMLNVEAGGDTVDKLHGIYIWWIKEIFDASRCMETERLERITRQMAAMRSGWEEVSLTRQSRQAQSAAAFTVQGLVG
jgi:flagellar protein FliS